MEAIHLTFGQNGRPGRSDAAPQKGPTDIGAAFSRALAALEGGQAKKTPGDSDTPEEDAVEVEEEAGPDAVTTEESGIETVIIADPAEDEETPDLALIEVASKAAPAESEQDGDMLAAPTAAGSRVPNPHLPTVAAVAGQGPQQGVPASSEAPVRKMSAVGIQAPRPVAAETARPATDAPPLRAKQGEATVLSAAAEPARPAAGALPFLAKQVVAALPRGTTPEISAAVDGEAAIDPNATYPEAEAADFRPIARTASVDRPIPHIPPAVAFDLATTASVEARLEDGGVRPQGDSISLLQTDAALPLMRSAPAATIAPTIEARPVLHAIAEASIKAQDGTIELRLSPEELGRVRISMSHTDHGISVVLNVERDDTLALLRRHASELAAAFREAGLGEANIEFANREQRSAPDQQRREPGQAFGMLSDAGIEIDRPALRLPGDGGLDIRM